MAETLGLRVWGCRGSAPRLGSDQEKIGGNTSCLEVLHGGRERIILDAGTGIANLGDKILSEKRPDDPIHLFFSHYHWDHIMGLPFFGPIYFKGYTIHLYGMDGDKSTPQEMVQFLFGPMYSPIYSPENLLSALHYPAWDDQAQIDGVTVKTRLFKSAHPGGCLAFRVSADGKSFGFGADLELRDPIIRQQAVEFFRGVDLLVCDAQYTEEAYAQRVGWGHSSLKTAHEIGRDCGAKKVVGFHFDVFRSDLEIQSEVARLQTEIPSVSLEPAEEGKIFRT